MSRKMPTLSWNSSAEALRKRLVLSRTILRDELQEMADTAQKVLTEAGWDETGKQIVKGLTEGVQSEKSSFVDEIAQLALAGVQAAEVDTGHPLSVEGVP